MLFERSLYKKKINTFIAITTPFVRSKNVANEMSFI